MAFRFVAFPFSIRVSLNQNEIVDIELDADQLRTSAVMAKIAVNLRRKSAHQ
jgi:hypothetical protein